MFAKNKEKQNKTNTNKNISQVDDEIKIIWILIDVYLGKDTHRNVFNAFNDTHRNVFNVFNDTHRNVLNVFNKAVFLTLNTSGLIWS